MSSSRSVLARPGFDAVVGIPVSQWLLDDLSDESAFPRMESGDSLEPGPPERTRLVAEDDAATERLRQEAERALAEETERRVREAYQQGYEEGRQKGEVAEGARLRSAVHAAEEALEELRAGEMRWTGSIEENICALAVAVARHIIGRELRTDAEPVLELVRNALAEFALDQPIRIRVNPADLASIRQLQDSEDPAGRLERERDARWIPDPQVAPGGCVVEGRERIVDGRVDVALERIYRRLTYTNV